MANRFEICCHDSILIGTRSEFHRLTCEAKHFPLFNLFHHKVNNGYFYCVNREQLGQYWRCVVEDRNTFCPDRCDKCTICQEMSNVFTELQDSYFFYPNSHQANNQE